LKSSSWLGTVTIHVQAKRLFNEHSFKFVRWFGRLKHSHIHISKDVVVEGGVKHHTLKPNHHYEKKV